MAKRGKRAKSSRKKRTTIPGWIWLLIVGIILVAAGVGLSVWRTNNVQAAAELAPPEVLAQGEVIYNEICASCHGPEGEGNVGPALNGSMHSWHHMDNQLRSVILDGRPGTAMVGHRDHLTEEEVDAVISYFKAWWTPEQRQMQLTGQHSMP